MPGEKKQPENNSEEGNKILPEPQPQTTAMDDLQYKHCKESPETVAKKTSALQNPKVAKILPKEIGAGDADLKQKEDLMKLMQENPEDFLPTDEEFQSAADGKPHHNKFEDM